MNFKECIKLHSLKVMKTRRIQRSAMGQSVEIIPMSAVPVAVQEAIRRTFRLGEEDTPEVPDTPSKPSKSHH